MTRAILTGVILYCYGCLHFRLEDNIPYCLKGHEVRSKVCEDWEEALRGVEEIRDEVEALKRMLFKVNTRESGFMTLLTTKGHLDALQWVLKERKILAVEETTNEQRT